jgi:hypothetical protein
MVILISEEPNICGCCEQQWHYTTNGIVCKQVVCSSVANNGIVGGWRLRHRPLPVSTCRHPCYCCGQCTDHFRSLDCVQSSSFSTIGNDSPNFANTILQVAASSADLVTYNTSLSLWSRMAWKCLCDKMTELGTPRT